tara:strand:+ start:2790 stop:3365 length:576 start_codon:yes stop_codon:yes gene_type:complete
MYGVDIYHPQKLNYKDYNIIYILFMYRAHGEEPLALYMEKRVIKELSKYNIPGDVVDRRYLYVPIELPEPLQQIAENAGKDPALILDLKFYPFQVPRITYLSTPAERIYMCRPIFNTIMRKLTNEECLCCNSFICPENWVPSNNLKQIIDEFKNIAKLKTRAVEIFICDKVQRTLIPDGLPVQDFPISQFL